jgi:hypothetical protein
VATASAQSDSEDLVDANNQATVTTTVPTAFHTVTPCRIVDTRAPDGPTGGPELSASVERRFPVASRCGVPPNAKAVSLNVTVTQPAAAGHVTVYAPEAVITSSTINYGPGQTRANNAVIALGLGGTLAARSIQGQSGVHLLIDVNGYFE